MRTAFYRYFPAFDFVASSCAVAIYGVVGWHFDALCAVTLYFGKEGTGLFGALVSGLASLLGFSIAAVTIVTGLVMSRELIELRASESYGDFWRAFTFAIRALALACAVSIISLFANYFEPARAYIVAANVFSLVLVAISLVRSLITLEVLVRKVGDKQQKQARDQLQQEAYPAVKSD